MKPFKFKPILKSIVWGGNRIAPYKGIATDQKNIGESWELSGVKGEESVVAEGEYEGWRLPDLIERLGGQLVGNTVYMRHGNEFPLLIKFIDAEKDLSIQVHPDDELSRARHGKNGKTEMWYVVDAGNGAHLKSGLTKSITPDEYCQLVADGKITDVLQDYEVHPGDVFFLPAGRIHAIGAGSFVAEIQQTSDVTYRIYDYGRKGLDGKPRQLHTDMAKYAIDYHVHPDYRTSYTPKIDESVELVSCKYFKTDLLELDKDYSLDLTGIDSFMVVMCLDGEADFIDEENDTTHIKRGDTILIPAISERYRICPDKKARFLLSYIKQDSEIDGTAFETK